LGVLWIIAGKLNSLDCFDTLLLALADPMPKVALSTYGLFLSLIPFGPFLAMSFEPSLMETHDYFSLLFNS
jgi:hypothetical protein